MLGNGHHLHTADGCHPVVVPPQGSQLSVVTSFTNSSSVTSKDSFPLVAVLNPNNSLSKDCPPLVEMSVVKPLQASEFSTNSGNKTIKRKQLLPGMCATVVPEKLRRLSCDVVSDTEASTTVSFPKLTLTTHTTYTNSTASHALKPVVVNTTQNKPIVSILNSNSYPATIVPKKLESFPSSPTFIPVARKMFSTSLENLKKNSTVCSRTVTSLIPVSKLVTSDVKSVESQSVNLNTASPVPTKRFFMVGVTMLPSQRASDIPCSSDSVTSVDGAEADTDKQTVVATTAVTSNKRDENGRSQNYGIFSVRILGERSENDIYNLKTPNETPQNDSISGVTSSDEKSQNDSVFGVTASCKKSQNGISSIDSSNEKSQNAASSVITSNRKLPKKRVYGIRSSDKKTMDKAGAALPKQKSPTNTSSRKFKSKAQEVTRSIAKNTRKARSKRNSADVPVGMMVTRSSSRKK